MLAHPPLLASDATIPTYRCCIITLETPLRLLSMYYRKGASQRVCGPSNAQPQANFALLTMHYLTLLSSCANVCT